MGDRLRVTGQLIDAANGAHLWAEKFEGTVAAVFSFQDRITEGVVGVIEPAIRKAEIERARRKPAANLDAYELFLTALPLVYGMEPERLVEAIALIRGSAALDPGFALPPAYAAWVYMDEAKVMFRRVRELSPNLTIKVIEEGADPDEDQFATAMLPGLRKAGLPER